MVLVPLVLALVCAAGAPAVASHGADETVYVTRTGSKYHRSTCSSLRSSSIPMKLSEATARYGPCGRCSPPTLKQPTKDNDEDLTALKEPAKQKTQPAVSGRCQATTKKDTQCSRRAKAGRSYCWQHGG